MKIRDKLILILVIGLLLRLIVMPHTQHPATGVKVDLLDEMLLLGMNPLLRGSGFGTALYLFYMPMYIVYNLLQQIGISYNFVLYTLMKMPPLIGDLIIFYSLYEIIRITTNSKDKALNISAFYFLNPYVLFIGYWVGHPEQLSASLVLLSILFLIKGKNEISGIFYAMSIFTRYIPFLLFPVYITYLWLNKRIKGLSLGRFILGFALAGIPLSFPYIFASYKMYQSSPQIFISYFSHFFEASTVASAYTLNREEFMYNFTGFITSVGLWDRLSFLLGAKMFLITYFVIFFILFWFIWRKRGEIAIKEATVFPMIPYTLFLILIPLQQHHYLAWILPFLYLASSLSIIPGYFVTILWTGNLLLDPITGQDYKFAWGNTFVNPFPEMTRHFVNFSLQQSISALMGIVLLLSLYFYIKSMKNQNFYIRNQISKPNKLKVTFFIVLFVSYLVTDMIRMVYRPTLYTYIYSVLFGLFILLEFFGLGSRNGPALLRLEGRSLTRLLNVSSMLLILGAVSTYLWTPSYFPAFVVLSVISLWSWKCDIEPGDIRTVFSIAGIFLFIATTYILLLAPNYLTLTLYAIFLATWVASQLWPEAVITARMKPPGEELYTYPQKQR